MRANGFKQFAFIREDSPEEFEKKVNEKMEELRNGRPEIKTRLDGHTMMAEISYTKSVCIPESLADAYELQNIRFTCQDCPMFEPIKNRDGSPNLRVKYGDCKYSEYGRTYKDSRCCDTLYKLFRTGEVRLCLAESES